LQVKAFAADFRRQEHHAVWGFLDPLDLPESLVVRYPPVDDGRLHAVLPQPAREIGERRMIEGKDDDLVVGKPLDEQLPEFAVFAVVGFEVVAKNLPDVGAVNTRLFEEDVSFFIKLLTQRIVEQFLGIPEPPVADLLCQGWQATRSPQLKTEDMEDVEGPAVSLTPLPDQVKDRVVEEPLLRRILHDEGARLSQRALFLRLNPPCARDVTAQKIQLFSDGLSASQGWNISVERRFDQTLKLGEQR